MFCAIAATIIFSGLSMPAASQGYTPPEDLMADLGPAQEAISAGEYDTAFEIYRKVAERDNNPLAQFNIALFYDFGWGREVNHAEACRWYAKSTIGDIPVALMRHADCLRYGTAGEPDPAGAAIYYQKAADNGLPLALCDLAELYMQGDGVAPDPVRAVNLCLGVAEQGYARALSRTGLFYLQGDQSIRDNKRALQLFVAGANANDPECMHWLGFMMREQLVANAGQEDARDWYEKAATAGYAPAYYPTAEMYYHAEGSGEDNIISEEDLAKLYMWLQVAAQAAPDADTRQQARDKLSKVLLVIPKTWPPALDAQVAEHLAKHPPAG